MAIAAGSEFDAAVTDCIKLLRAAAKKKGRLNPASRLAGDLASKIAAIRKSFLKLQRDYPIARYPKVAFQLAAMEPLLNNLVSTFPDRPKDMLLLLMEMQFKHRADVSAEIELEHSPADDLTEPPFLPDDLIEDRHYVLKRVLWEVNRAYSTACYNSCAAMIRRLTETLIIEAYEHSQLRAVIVDGKGDYLPFKDLIGKATSQAEFKLTRETKRVLPELKFFGDLAAHNRLSLVRKPDLDRLHNATRCAIEELYRNI